MLVRLLGLIKYKKERKNVQVEQRGKKENFRHIKDTERMSTILRLNRLEIPGILL
jgi:hypothetical protein